MPFLGFFLPKMPYLGIFGLESLKYYCSFRNKYLQIFLIAKFCQKTKIPKFGTKNALLEYFWARILKNYCHIWNQHPQICQKWVLTVNFVNTVNFDVGLAFSKDPGSAFSEGPGPGPSPIHKVRHKLVFTYVTGIKVVQSV